MARRRSAEVIVSAGAAFSAARVLRRSFTARMVSRSATFALRHGVRSRSRGWIYAGAALQGARQLQRFVGRSEDVYRIKLKPGERLEISERAPAKRSR